MLRADSNSRTLMLTANRKPFARLSKEPPTLPVGTQPRQTVELDCGTISYLRYGSGSPLLLVHGIPTSCRLWEPLLGILGAHYECFVPDLNGLGRSAPKPNADLSSPGQAQMLNQFLDAMGVDQCFAVFHDQGGSHGMQFLKAHGDRVKAVMFTNVVCYDNWPVPAIALTAWLGRRGWIPRLAKLRLLQAVLRFHTLPQTVFRGDFPEDLRNDWYWALDYGGEPLDHWVAYVISQSAQWTQDAIPTLREWNKPAKVLWAAQDQYLPVSWGHKLASDIPGAADDPSLLPFAGHFWQAEVPISGAQAIVAFFENVQKSEAALVAEEESANET